MQIGRKGIISTLSGPLKNIFNGPLTHAMDGLHEHQQR